MSQGLTPGVPGAPEPRMYLRSGYFLLTNIAIMSSVCVSVFSIAVYARLYHCYHQKIMLQNYSTQLCVYSKILFLITQEQKWDPDVDYKIGLPKFPYQAKPFMNHILLINLCENFLFLRCYLAEYWKIYGYCNLPKNYAENLINFLKNSNLHCLIPSCTFINLWKFSAKTFIYIGAIHNLRFG